MPNEPQIGVIPDGTPPVSGNPPAGHTAEQLHQAAEKARMEERTKLRVEIEAARAEASTAKDKVKELETVLAETKMKLQAFESAKSENGVDVVKAVDSALSSLRLGFEKEFSTKLEDLQSKLTAEQSRREALEVSSLRSRLIDQNGGAASMIPELVTGRTEEEILASIEASKAILARHVKNGSGPAASSQPNNGSPSAPAANGQPLIFPAVPSPAPGAGNGGGSTTPVKRLSPEEFRANRENLRRTALARYQQQVGGNPVIGG